ncbi:uncharacterized protein LOC118257426 isoform X2 [Cygnus atratus]|uniref:uncharacterized protein LOC118257426 isoform X2 n=1 Tax=Cygnus atratus TaxID=8868 RepID=UPI0015D63FA4|nr:uncharacterized protein LOC118257426 isoform X2 [Cygnus atratus]
MCGRGGCGPLLEQKAPGRLSKERSGDAGGDARGAAVLSPDERVGCSAGNHCRSAAEGNPPPCSGSQNTLSSEASSKKRKTIIFAMLRRKPQLEKLHFEQTCGLFISPTGLEGSSLQYYVPALQQKINQAQENGAD